MAVNLYKSMGSYHIFAWNDAMELASWLETDYPIGTVKATFEAMPLHDKIEFESKNEAFIQEIIKKSVSQRPAYLKRIGKNVGVVTQGVVILFAIIGQVRVKEFFDLRDQYVGCLIPGGGNRVTCESVFAFIQEVRGLVDYDWPWEVFNAYGGWSDDEDCDDAQT